MNRKTLVALLVAFGGTLIMAWSILAVVMTRGNVHFARHDAVMGPVVLTIAASFLVLWLFLAIGVGIFVYRDARQRGMEPVLWTLVALLIPYFVGLVVYLVVRKPRVALCPACGSALPEGAAYCAQCGAALAPTCPRCNSGVPAGAAYCPACGAPMTVQAAEGGE